MEWIETYKHTTMDWKEYELVWNDFILVKMVVSNNKVHLFTQSLQKHKDKEFNFMRMFLGREDIDQVKQEIINLFNNN
jgi:hypothetical protein